MFLEECKYVFKEKKMPEYITDEKEISSHDSDREDSDIKNADKKILMKIIKYKICLVFIFLMSQMKKS